jgi:hypothetical protein
MSALYNSFGMLSVPAAPQFLVFFISESFFPSYILTRMCAFLPFSAQHNDVWLLCLYAMQSYQDASLSTDHTCL